MESDSKPAGNGFSMRIVVPSERLRPFVSAIYAFEIDRPHAINDLSVPEWGNLRLVYAGGYHTMRGTDDGGDYIDHPVLQGPTCKAAHFRVQHCALIGVGLLPAAFAQFWNIDAASVADQQIALSAFSGERAVALEHAVAAAPDIETRLNIVEAFMQTLLDDGEPSPAVEEIARVQALLNDPAISEAEELSDILGINPVALARFCKRRFGFPPKLLLRRQRFLRMLDALHGRPYREWPDFLDPHYTDQSHMIRDFRYFMGMSPTRYLALPRLVQQASGVNRTQVLGNALQGLS